MPPQEDRSIDATMGKFDLIFILKVKDVGELEAFELESIDRDAS